MLAYIMVKKKGSEGHGILTSFLGGFIFTLILVVVIPVVCNHYIQPIVEDAVGDNAFMWFSSSLIVTLIMLGFMLLFMIVFGGEAILKKFGIIGVIALILAYWALGNLPGAILPVACIIIMFLWQRHKDRN